MGSTLEEALSNSIASQVGERTYIDKLLAKEDAIRLRNLLVMKELEREDYLEILSIISSNHLKLLNLGDWDRYLLAKFFVWIREYVKVAEMIFDYRDALRDPSKKMQLTPITEKLLDDSRRLIEHNVKFLVDLFMVICNTTMSLGNTGFRDLSGNRFEFDYGTGKMVTDKPEEPKAREPRRN